MRLATVILLLFGVFYFIGFKARQEPFGSHDLMPGAYAGITIMGIPEEIADLSPAIPHGVAVMTVSHGYPAEEKGIIPGDIITSLDGNALKNMLQFFEIMHGKKPADELSVGILRGTEKLSFDLILAADRPESN
ncbi:MAG: PDZ domain-containing protein [Candidatus Falkowbacteria bacterium]